MFKTKDGLVLAVGYIRIVIGERGPYIEFDDEHIVHEYIEVPDGEEKRLGNNIYYYDEYRSKRKQLVTLTTK